MKKWELSVDILLTRAEQGLFERLASKLRLDTTSFSVVNSEEIEQAGPSSAATSLLKNDLAGPSSAETSLLKTDHAGA